MSLTLAHVKIKQPVKISYWIFRTIFVMWDGSTNNSITEQEVIYVIYVDPKIHFPVMKFFKIATPDRSQDAPGLKEAIISAFSRHGLCSSLKKMVFFPSDGASVNSDSNSALIGLFQEDYPWLSFIWCFSHCFELSLKDALSELFEPVDTSLTHLFHLYSNSSKKYRN